MSPQKIHDLDIEGDGRFIPEKDNIYTYTGNKFHIDISSADHVIWPNREGERIDNIQDIDHTHSLTYPANGSMRAVLIGSKEKQTLIGAKADHEGNVSRIDISHSMLSISSKPNEWYIESFTQDKWNKTADRYHRFSQARPRERITSTTPTIQVQLGLIEPDGTSHIPDGIGYGVLEETAQMMQERIGDGHILHVFGWAAGHDRDYPNYEQNETLSMDRCIEDAIDSVHEHGQKVMLYVNARIASDHIIDSDPQLKQAILLDENGRPITETYNSNRFYVMDPTSPAWIQSLTEHGKDIEKYGADGVQLDQIAFQAALGCPKGNWGEGYTKLIEEFQRLGLKVWTEGVSDIYPANYLQMINGGMQARWWDDGQIRTGNPLGEYNPGFFADIHGQNGDFSYPLGKTLDIGEFKRLGATIAEVNDDGFNPFYRLPNDHDTGYIEQTKQTVDKVLNLF